MSAEVTVHPHPLTSWPCECEPESAPRCGTYGEYQAHRKRGEAPCLPCTVAAREYQRKYRTDDENRRREAELTAARERAVWRLAKMHPGEFRALVEEESFGIPPKARASRTPDCHPNRKHRAKGMCTPCYRKHLRQVNR